MKNSILVVLMLTAGTIEIRGQSISPATINATGGTSIVGTQVFDWSIGEMTMVSTFTSPDVIVTQGVLQPFDGLARVVENPLLKQLNVFPNPATGIVNLQYTSAVQGSLCYRLLDMVGRVIIDRTLAVKQGTTTEQINIAGLAVASYMLEVIVNTGSEKSDRVTYKVQKFQ